MLNEVIETLTTIEKYAQETLKAELFSDDWYCTLELGNIIFKLEKFKQDYLPLLWPDTEKKSSAN